MFTLFVRTMKSSNVDGLVETRKRVPLDQAEHLSTQRMLIRRKKIGNMKLPIRCGLPGHYVIKIRPDGVQLVSRHDDPSEYAHLAASLFVYVSESFRARLIASQDHTGNMPGLRCRPNELR